VRQRLVNSGDIQSPGYGIWGITANGRARLRNGLPAAQSVTPGSPASAVVSSTPPTATQEPPSNFEETVEDYITAFKAKVLQKLHDLTPKQFEEFAGALLKAYGFQNVTVTGKSGDGGIDGHGELKVGLAVLNAGFQCKRWEGPVGSKEVQAFRGAVQGQFEQGYFFTTSTFSRAAQDESIRKGAAPIILFDGEQLVQIMIEKGIGVKRVPVEVYEDQVEDLLAQNP